MARRVLIVDGTATNRIAFRAALSSARYDVTAVTSAEEAAVELESRGTDVVIVDASLPDLASSRLFSGLAEAWPTATPVIVVTNADDTDSRAEWFERGASAVLSRPVERGWLLTNLRALLRQQDAVAELARQVNTAERLGFVEDAAPFLPPHRLGVVAPTRIRAERLMQGVVKITGVSFSHLTPEEVLMDAGGRPPDVLVISSDRTPEEALWLLAELRSSPRTRRTAILLEVERGDTETAGRALDIGATGTLSHDAGARERAVVLTRAQIWKATADEMRERLENSLRMAAMDHLTGLFNRRYALQHLDELTRRRDADGALIGVILVDVDHFKRINDRFGHSAGDLILTEVAKRLQVNLREHDLVSRFGGEEFLVVLSDTTPDEAVAAAERLRRAIEAPDFNAGGGTLQATISLGVACGTAHPAKLIAQADGALYRAKREGRNRTCLADKDEPASSAAAAHRPLVPSGPILRRTPRG